MKLHCVHMNRTEPLKLTQIELWFEECSKINTAISRRASQYHHIEGSIVFLIVSEHIFGIDSNFEVVSNQSDFFLSNSTYILMVWSWAFRCWKNVNQHWEVEELVSAVEESLEGVLSVASTQGSRNTLIPKIISVFNTPFPNLICGDTTLSGYFCSTFLSCLRFHKSKIKSDCPFLALVFQFIVHLEFITRTPPPSLQKRRKESN